MRAQFVETVLRPYGNSSQPPMVPVGGVEVTVYVVNDDGSEGGVANTYMYRTDTVAGPTSTDDNGTIAFYLEPGDYNIHFDDPDERISSFERGFAALTNHNTELLNASLGDLKLSVATEDHGDSTGREGIFDWIRLDGGPDGYGRLLLASDYGDLWRILGSPTLDGGGRFRLPNPSGRAILGAGEASGLSERDLLASGGTESDVHSFLTPGFEIDVLSITPKHVHDMSSGTAFAASWIEIVNFNDDPETPMINIQHRTDYRDAGYFTSGRYSILGDVRYADHQLDDEPYSGIGEELYGKTGDAIAPTGPTGASDGPTANQTIVIDAHSTVDQSIDKMQPWIAFTLFVKANG